MKAMIFAAGRGERMRPLTDAMPKPLLTVANKPIIVYLIEALKRASITDLVINLSYMPDMIQHTLGDGRAFGVNIAYSYEGDTPLETAGGIIHAQSLLGDAPFIALSGDIITDYDFSLLHKRVETLKSAHVVLVDNPSFHLEGDFALMPNGEVAMQGANRLTYGNIGLFHPRAFDNVGTKVIGLGDIIRAETLVHQVTGEYFNGQWFNIGTPEALASVNQQFEDVN